MEEQKNTIEPKDTDAENNKMIALLSYFFLLCLVPLLTKKDSSFAYFHAKQGLVLCIGWFFTWVPFVGPALAVFLGIMSIIGIINVMNEKKSKLPLVGELADKLSI